MWPDFEPWHLLVYASALCVAYVLVVLPVGNWLYERKRSREEKPGEVRGR